MWGAARGLLGELEAAGLCRGPLGASGKPGGPRLAAVSLPSPLCHHVASPCVPPLRRTPVTGLEPSLIQNFHTGTRFRT